MKMKTEAELIEEAKKNGVTFPVLQFSENPEDDRELGRYGKMAFNLLYTRQKDRFMDHLIEGTLMSWMHKIDKQAESLVEDQVWAVAKKADLPENPEARSRRMEEIREQVAQTVVEDLLRVKK